MIGMFSLGQVRPSLVYENDNPTKSWGTQKFANAPFDRYGSAGAAAHHLFAPQALMTAAFFWCTATCNG